jgi:hypothetical protein
MSTYEPIASQTLGSAAPSVTFSSLPQNYTDLILVSNYGISANLYGLRIRFNDDTGSNYSDTVLYGNGSSAASFRDTSATSIITSAVGVSNNVLDYNFICNIQNYSNAATNKTVLIRGNATNRETLACVGLWRNTAPITSVTVFVGSGNILAGTTFTIYGVAAGNSSAKASGGNIVVTDGSFWYHAFTSTGTFIPNESLSASVLLVGGGGGGGNGGGAGAGGGGAGGVRAFTSQSLVANTVYPAIVGAGGVSALTYRQPSGKGGNTTLGSLSATGGGFGGTYTSNGNGGAGGSGGGATANDSVTKSGGAGNQGGYTPVEGFAGANTPVLGIPNGSGGGGASEASATPNNSAATAGGAGTDIYNSINFSSWLTATKLGSSTKVGGGGGGASYLGATGGAGGVGGGGTGETRGSGGQTRGLPNTGGGGGGSATDSSVGQGNGGSGLIIIRYAV